MDDLIDFEALIDLNGLLPNMTDEMNRSTDQESSQEPLENVLDKMCESLDADGIEINSKNVDEQADEVALDTVVDLDEFNKIFDETCASKDMESRHVDGLVFNEEGNRNELALDHGSVTDLKDFTDIISDEVVQFVDNEENLKAEKQEVEVGDGTDLKEFEEIFNETSAYNGGLDRLENKVSIFCGNNFAKLDLDVNMLPLDFCNEPKLDEMSEIVKDTDAGAILRDVNNKYQIGSHSIDLDVCNNSNEVKVESDSNHEHESKDLDIISISSEEPLVLEYSDSDTDDGYNSSDFECISESEAQKEGLLFKSKLNIEDPGIPVQNATKSIMNTENRSNLITDPNHDFIKYHRNRFLPCRISQAVAHRRTHVLPEGESLLDLFRGIYSPIVMNNLYYMSNKNVMPPKSMSITDGFGFDLPHHGSESAETKADAAETIKKIRFLYPDENRKRRRRF